MYKYERLARKLSGQIASGSIEAGQKLPSIRQLSEMSGLSKISVQSALQQLESKGLVTAKNKSGYYVTEQTQQTKAPVSHNRISAPQRVNMPGIFQQIMARSAAFDIKPESVPTSTGNHLQILNRHISRAMRSQSTNKALYYSPPEGDPDLRKQLSLHCRTHGLNISAEEVCITSGCQNSLFLALMACSRPGDNVIVESPAFYGVLQLLEQLRLNVIEVSVSTTQGITARQLDEASRKWNAKICILTSNFATPTGACIPRQEKKSIAELAETSNLTIIEDDIYGDLGFHYRPETIKSFDTSGRVILCSSFSKSLSRDVRIGWIAGGLYQDKIIQLKLVNQLAGNRSVQEGVASFLQQGHYRRHLLQYRKQLSEQRDQLRDMIHQYFPGNPRFTLPDGGLCLWIELEPKVNSLQLYKEALQQGITITPGPLFSSKSNYSNYLRLSYAHSINGPREKALRDLGNMLR